MLPTSTARLRYISGAHHANTAAVAHQAGIGLLTTPATNYRRQLGAYPFWAADNGAYRRGADHRCLDREGEAPMTVTRSIPVAPASTWLEVRAATTAKANQLAETAAAAGVAVAAHPRYPTRLTLRGEPSALVALLVRIRSDQLITADAAFEATLDLITLLLMREGS